MEDKTLSVTFCPPVFPVLLKQESETREHPVVIYPSIIFTTHFPRDHPEVIYPFTIFTTCFPKVQLHVIIASPYLSSKCIFCNICPKQNSVYLSSFLIQPILTSWISLMSYESYKKNFSRYFILWQSQRGLRCRLNSVGTNFSVYFFMDDGSFSYFCLLFVLAQEGCNGALGDVHFTLVSIWLWYLY